MKRNNKCIECACDTRVEGYVNRIPADNGTEQAFLCGNCLAQWDYEHDLLVADGEIGFEFANDPDTVMKILADRILLAEKEADRDQAAITHDLAVHYYDKNGY